jgi:hypothetical protein
MKIRVGACAPTAPHKSIPEHVACICTRKENNGQVEGQITRLKLLKRQSMAVPGLICYACECSMPLRDDLLQQQDCLFERQTLQKAYET